MNAMMTASMTLQKYYLCARQIIADVHQSGSILFGGDKIIATIKLTVSPLAV